MQASRLLEAHLPQYLESEISRERESEMIRQTVARVPPCAMISTEKDGDVFDTAATMPINVKPAYDSLILSL